MKRIICIILAALCMMPVLLYGQYMESALQYSNLFYSGSARTAAMSNAFGAIGGDFSSLSINPAGMGVYRSHEVSFTPNIYNTRSFSSYFGNKEEEFRTRFNFNNAGAVFAFPLNQGNKKVKYVQFGIGYNRLANFNNSVYFQGFNNRNSFVRTLSDYATAFGVNEQNPIYPEDLAFLTNLLIRVDHEDGSVEWVPDMTHNVNQEAIIKSDGGIDEMVLSFGGNYADKLYFGATIGIPFISYWSSYEYAEWTSKEQKEDFNTMYYDEVYQSNAVGINGKFGLIYTPVSMIRVGVAVHTPTYYGNIKESYYYAMQSFFNESTQWNAAARTPEQVYNYSQVTPMRLIGSAAFVYSKIGMINVDYEWVDHSKNRLSPSRNHSGDNGLIENFYKSQHIVRAGAEVNLGNFFFRGGYGWYSSPYRYASMNDGSIHTWSCGAGFRVGSFGLDFAYQHISSRLLYYPYNADPYGYWGNDFSPVADLKNKANSYMVTLSYRY